MDRYTIKKLIIEKLKEINTLVIKEFFEDIELLQHQKEFVYTEAECPALIGGFGSGKTESVMYRALKLILKYGPIFKEAGLEKYTIGIYTATYDIMKLISIEKFKNLLDEYNIKYNLNRKENYFILEDLHAVIQLKNFNDIDSIKTIFETSDCIFDELDIYNYDKSKKAFETLISANIQIKPDGSKNTSAIVTSPQGLNGFVYKKWEETKEPERYLIIRGKTKDNKFLPDSYIETLKKIYPEKKWKQYLEGEYPKPKKRSKKNNIEFDLNKI